MKGTGTEDYFCDAWGFREFNRPYYGVVMYDSSDVGQRICAYRWHIQDPVHFKKSLKVTIEHKGVMRNDKGQRFTQFHERADLYSSVAFWYQTGKCKRFATLPPAEERTPRGTVVEFEDSQKSAKVVPADSVVTTDRHPQASGSGMLVCRFPGEKGGLTLPFTLSRPASGVARVRLGCFPDAGAWSLSLDGKPIDEMQSANLHAPKLTVVDYRIGMVDLAAGEHNLTFESKGGCGAAQGHELNVDAMTVDEITPYAVPAESK